jgi:GT2 family glycosyltransferase
MEKKLTIIMVARNQLKYTQRAIESLKETTNSEVYKLLFFDNGSDHETSDWVLNYCQSNGIELKYQYSTENRGFNACVNKGYEMCDTTYSLTCHNDVKFCKYWYDNMMRRFKNPEVAAVGPVISFAMGPQSVYWALKTMGCDVKYLLGLFFLCDMNVINQIKTKYGEILSEAYGVLGDKEELELCYRISRLGFKFEIARDVYIEHEGEITFVDTLGTSEAFHEYQEKQRGIIDGRLGKNVVDEMLGVSISNPIKLMIGIMTRTEYVHYQNVISLLKIWGNTGVWKTFYHIARGHPAESRNQIVRAFLKTDCTHLLFIDDDQIFNHEAVNILINHDVDVCTGITWQRGEPHVPCIFIADADKKVIFPLDAYQCGMVEVDATGGYFLLIKRHVLEAIPSPWFKYGDTSTGYSDGKDIEAGLGEDVSFGLKVKLAGFDIYCDSDLEIEHLGASQIINHKFVQEYKDSGAQEKFIENKFKEM